MNAQYETSCPWCDHPIKPGQPIVNGERGWEHKECPDAQPEAGTICHVCFLEKAVNGECGCQE